jgi:phosphoribosyl 1,2-cyclic phosphodiesterase
LEVGELRVTSFPVHHPGGSRGYRIDAAAGSIVYVTDHECGDATSDNVVREAAAGADVLIFDAQYTPAEYKRRRGWGHSTWRDAVAMAQGAGVRLLVLFHHDPERDDEAVCRIEAQAQELFPHTVAAWEGLEISLPRLCVPSRCRGGGCGAPSVP